MDDPRLFGAIAAANSMSDVYAMGGEVMFALNVAGTPESLSVEILAEILDGGAAKVQEAGGQIAGGHTVTNPELFFGLSVTGRVDPRAMFTKNRLRSGDLLFLTKPLGTGLITSAQIVDSHELIEDADLEAAIASMTLLNRDAARVARQHEVQAGTDITGFGLLGHAMEMVGEPSSPVGLRIQAAEVPLLPHLRDYVKRGVATRAGKANRAHFGQRVRVDDAVDDARLKALWEAETSGGLLLAVSPRRADAFSAACDREGVNHWCVGTAVDSPDIEVV